MSCPTEALVEAAVRVLNTADPFDKARLGDEVATKWLQGSITLPYHPSLHLSVPDRPARLSNVRSLPPSSMPISCNTVTVWWNASITLLPQVKLVPPGLMPKLGKAGSLQSRQAIVHSLVHTESWAIDLSWVWPPFLLIFLNHRQGNDNYLLCNFLISGTIFKSHWTLKLKVMEEWNNDGCLSSGYLVAAWLNNAVIF